MSNIADAFHQICTDALKTGSYYLCLMVSVPYYGGPEEGGWWGSDNLVVAYKEYPTEEDASEARLKVQELAEQLTKEAKDVENEYCARTLDWLEERNLEPDYLPELDGSEEYYVVVTDELPTNTYGERQYS